MKIKKNKVATYKKHLTIVLFVLLILVVLSISFFTANTSLGTDANAQSNTQGSYYRYLNFPYQYKSGTDNPEQVRKLPSNIFARIFILAFTGQYDWIRDGLYPTITPATQLGVTPPVNAICPKPEGCGGNCNPQQNDGCGYGGCRFWEACIDIYNNGVYACKDLTNGQDYWKITPPPANACASRVNIPIPTNITSIPSPTVTTSPNVTQNPSPTNLPAGSHLPIAIDYSNYAESYNQYPPTYVYAMMNRTYNAASTTQGISGLHRISGNVVKMIMISEYNALDMILRNHETALKASGVTWVGYNAERDGRTPEDELNTIFSTDPSVNIINKMGRLTDQYGLKLMLGPVTPMWNEYFGGRDNTNPTDGGAAIRAMVGDNCYLDGVAFQEQKQITSTNKEDRTRVVAQRTGYFRENAPNCPQFESMVQLMSSWCRTDASWEECRAYYNLLKGLTGKQRINSLAIWASGEERNDLPSFVQTLRR